MVRFNRRHQPRALATIIGFIVAILAIILLATWYFMAIQNQPQRIVASAISEEDTPSYGACQVVTTNALKEADIKGSIQTLLEAVKRGETAPNGTVAESCIFAFSTARSNQNSLAISIYPYLPISNIASSEAVNSDWSEMTGLEYTAYFRTSHEDDGKTTVYTLRLLPGARNLLFVLKQPTLKLTYTPNEAKALLRSVAELSDLSVVMENKPSSYSEDLPPEPNY